MTVPPRSSAPAPRRIILVAGPSGSGKGVLVQRSGLPLVPLDEFYRDHDDPSLPRRFGIVDWDHPASWNADAALQALTALAHDGLAELPSYSISRSRRLGSRTLDARGSDVIVAEGIFAAELVAPLRAAGLLADALVLSRPVPLVFTLRLTRDLREGRKSPLTLVRRGTALALEQRRDVARWTGAGMRATRLRAGVRELRRHRALAAADSRIRAHGVMPGVLDIAAVCFLREGDDGLELLAVRKQGTGSWMQPGGKLDPGESARECAVREIAEELGAAVEADALEHLCDVEAPAANEPSTVVRASVFLAPPDSLPRDVAVQAELAEARWLPLDRAVPGMRLAPLMTEHIMPHLRRLGAS